MKMNNNSGYCLKGWAIITDAKSPAFIENDPKGWRSSKYSTWTESIWEVPTARLFLQPSAAQQWTTFFVGVAVLLISFFLILWLRKHSESIFGCSPSSSTIEVAVTTAANNATC